VLVSQGQSETHYPLNGGLDLDFGTTCYWRVDEVNAPPDATTMKGELWSFTTEPIAYPIDGGNILTSASSIAAGQGPENTVNSSGLTEGLYSDVLASMWLTAPGAVGPVWIRYEFDTVYKLAEMWVWNHNGNFERSIGLGCRNVTIEYSLNGTDFTALGTTHEFAQASGKPGYAHNSEIDLGGITAKYVKLTVDSNWKGIIKQYGLSEVRFFSIPVLAREPNPIPGATGMQADTDLSWRAGREAAKHHVYLSTDKQAVMDGIALVRTVTSPSYAPALDLASTYYWRVDEVNDAQAPSLWQGAVWDFATQRAIVVEDFESYTDDMDAQEAIYQTWIDGYGTTTNGSQVGYAMAPFEEHVIVRPNSRQSMPLKYDNTVIANSEAKRTFGSPQDWAAHGVKGLTLWLYGDPTNMPQQMYVKINNVKVPYDGDAANLKLDQWQMWYIPLGSLNVGSVTSFAIGFDRIGAAGGQGLIWVDDLALYSYDRQLVTPKDPGVTGLQTRYQFEGNTNDSVGTRHLTVTGAPQYAAGKAGQAILLNGTSDFATVESSFDLPVYSAAMWFRVDGGTGQRDILSIYDSAGGFGISAEIGSDGTFRFLHRFPLGSSGGTNIYSTFSCADGAWYHAAIVKTPDTMTLYLNGMPAGSAANTTQFDKALARLTIGVLKHDSLQRYFLGAIDDVRLYNRVLSAAEVAGLAGVTVPYDKPF